MSDYTSVVLYEPSLQETLEGSVGVFHKVGDRCNDSEKMSPFHCTEFLGCTVVEWV